MTKKTAKTKKKTLTQTVMGYSKDPNEQAILLTIMPKIYGEQTVIKMLQTKPQTDAIQEWIKAKAKEANESYDKDLKKIVYAYKQKIDALLVEAATKATE